MSHRVLRAMYAGMVRGRARLMGPGKLRGVAATTATTAAVADVACLAATVVGLRAADVVFGCRLDGVLEESRGGASLPHVEDGLGRLYAAAGAGSTFRAGSERVAVAFFEAHEVGGSGWSAGLRYAAKFPVVLVVLPRWQGDDAGQTCMEARKAGVPGIAVDAADAIAIYRVVQESLIRARMGGGAALIEGVWFRLPGRKEVEEEDAVKELATYLGQRGIASERWLGAIGSVQVRRNGMGVGGGG